MRPMPFDIIKKKLRGTKWQWILKGVHYSIKDPINQATAEFALKARAAYF